MKWLRNRSFSTSTNEVEYINPNKKGRIWSIKCSEKTDHHRLNGNYQLTVSVNDKTLYDIIDKKEFPQHTSHYLRLDFEVTHSEKLYKFLSFLISQNELEYEVLEDIFKVFHIPLPEIKIEQDVLSLLNVNKIAEAKELALKAQNDKHYNVIIKLANLLNEDHMNDDRYNLEPQFIFDLYNEISKENPHFEAANRKILDMLWTQKPSSPEEKESLLELMLVHAMNAKDQKQIDHIYHELMGNTGLDPEIKDIQPNAATLIKLAKIIRESRKIEDAKPDEIKVKCLEAALKRKHSSVKINKSSHGATPLFFSGVKKIPKTNSSPPKEPHQTDSSPPKEFHHALQK